MKILRLLNKNYFSIITILIFSITSLYAEEQPVDIWNIDKKESKENLENETLINKSEKINLPENDIYKMQSKKKIDEIEEEENINSKELKLIGLYDPEDYGLDINMWSNSDGDQLENILQRLSKIELSRDAAEILQISL